MSRWVAVIDATKRREKWGEWEKRGEVKGGDKQSWVGSVVMGWGGCRATINQVPD